MLEAQPGMLISLFLAWYSDFAILERDLNSCGAAQYDISSAVVMSVVEAKDMKATDLCSNSVLSNEPLV